MKKRTKPKCPACGMLEPYHAENCPKRNPVDDVVRLQLRKLREKQVEHFVPCQYCGKIGGAHVSDCPVLTTMRMTLPISEKPQPPADNPWWKRAPIVIGIVAFVIQIAALVFAAGSIKADIDHLQQDVNEMKAWKADLEKYMRGGKP